MNTIIAIKDFLWDYLLVFLLVFSGLYLTIRLGFLQFSKIGRAFKELKNSKAYTETPGLVSPREALYTSLAAQIGTGNIAGVAAAIMLGGPGAVFWMWVSGFLGMAIMYSETVLSVLYREKKDNEYFGGPAYYLSRGIKNKKFGKILATSFAVFIVIALPFTGNMVQSNSVASVVNSSFNIAPVYTGAFIAILLSFIIIGGANRIAKIAAKVVPFMIAMFVIHGAVILLKFSDNIGEVFSSIFKNAFTLNAAIGGTVGFTLKQAIKHGLARGLFSNEAGMGSTPHANAIADVNQASKQGLISMITVLIDTFLVCTISALIILVTKANEMPADNYAGVLQNGFDIALGGSGSVFYAISVFFFAFSTILGWYYYGESNVMYLFGKDAINYYKIFAIIAVVGGTIVQVESIYNISDLLNGFMVIPNIIGILILTNEVVKNKKEYTNLIRHK